MARPPPAWSDLTPALVIGVVGFAAVAAGMLAPSRGGPAQALFPPWVSPARAFARAAAAPGWRPVALRSSPLGPVVALRRWPGPGPARAPRGAILLAGAFTAGCAAPIPARREPSR
ncbi:MAG: hypothetical protein ACP5NP_07280 [Acetobacteraceae bacterium]